MMDLLEKGLLLYLAENPGCGIQRACDRAAFGLAEKPAELPCADPMAGFRPSFSAMAPKATA
jgi:hypothetical protein